MAAVAEYTPNCASWAIVPNPGDSGGPLWGQSLEFDGVATGIRTPVTAVKEQYHFARRTVVLCVYLSVLKRADVPSAKAHGCTEDKADRPSPYQPVNGAFEQKTTKF